MLRWLYSLFFMLALPLVWCRLWWRGKTETGYRKHRRERLGWTDITCGETNVVWVHAVSVGEVRAALPLIGRLRQIYTDSTLLVTCMTPSGRATAREQLPDTVLVGYLPYDLPWMMSRLVKLARPKMLLVMETELWPNMLAACRANNVPTFLINARLSEKSRSGYARLLPIRLLARNTLRCFTAIFAQSENDRAHIVSLGADVSNTRVMGNLKFDMAKDSEAVTRGERWRAHLMGRSVILLASTREQEELPLVRAFMALRAQLLHTQPMALLVVVPRHPSRFDDVCQSIENLSLTVMRRSAIQAADNMQDWATDIARADVWLGDSMGEMQSYYAMCDVAIIGGSFRPLGGQNLIEAAALAKPVIMGPSTFNFSHAVAVATAADAMINVRDSREAMQAAFALLADDTRRLDMGARGQQFAHAHQGATARTLTAINDYIN